MTTNLFWVWGGKYAFRTPFSTARLSVWNSKFSKNKNKNKTSILFTPHLSFNLPNQAQLPKFLGQNHRQAAETLRCGFLLPSMGLCLRFNKRPQLSLAMSGRWATDGAGSFCLIMCIS